MNNEDMKNDELIHEFVNTLKKLETPDTLRDSNRRHVSDALRPIHTEQTKTSRWWKRQIFIPLPVAAGILILICVQLVLQFFTLPAYLETLKTKATGSTSTNSTGLSDKSDKPYYSEHSVYVAGIGFIQKVKTYSID